MNMSFRGFLAVALWVAIGFGIGEQLDPSSLTGIGFNFIWIGVLLIGIVAWNVITKDD